MRRSSAPSVLSKAKKPRFATPWVKENGSITTEALNVTEESTMESSQSTSLKCALQSIRQHSKPVKPVNPVSLQSTLPQEKNEHTEIEILSVPLEQDRWPVVDTIKQKTSKLSLPHQKSFVSPIISDSSSSVGNDGVDEEREQERDKETCHYYKVMWCKLSKKKHKTWEGDAILVTKGRTVILKDMEGKDIGHATGYKSSELSSLIEGSSLFIGGKEIEVMGVVSEEEWQSGRCFISPSSIAIPSGPAMKSSVTKAFQNPLKSSNKSNSISFEQRLHSSMYQPRFDPTSSNALVMPKPSQKHQLEYNTQGLPLVDVVVDPRLSTHLRPHQREGVVFLYECIMGMKEYSGFGAILADEMGLGKSLQCITLVWTLLKQGPYGGKPIIKRAVIITPGSLVKNWQREFQKWLGFERLNVFSASTDNRPEEFVKSPVYPVLLISYELFMKCYSDLSKIKFDIVICDEGHRLKNSNIKTSSVLSSLPTMKRIVLSGTPIQNDLMEFYSIVEFCNPGLLGSQSGFRKIYEEPIVQSRQIGATVEEKEIGRKRSEELTRLTSLFCLRRTQEINNKYLPPKVENIIFCRPSSLQLTLYRTLLSSRVLQSCLTHHVSESSPHLVCINALKKLCNSPSLIYTAAKNSEDIDQSLYDGILREFPDGYSPDCCWVEQSGKLCVLAAMLERVSSFTREKIVVVSNYTKTLDVLEILCNTFHYQFLRLDGQTPSTKRQSIVDRFNNKQCKDFVFLLSSKAGGLGLNLIGASRLILYDIDWNPANDLQAMARVWRDGQIGKVHIYRLLTTGTIEEKIFQRQVSKQGLSGVVEQTNKRSHSGSGHVQFSLEELRDLFSLDITSKCITHDQLNCHCHQEDLEQSEIVADLNESRTCSLGRQFTRPVKNLSIDQLKQWKHLSSPFSLDNIKDEVLLSALNNITFIIQNETTTQLQ